MDFSDKAATWDDDPTKAQRAKEIAAAIRRSVQLRPTDRAMEFGGGTGLLSRDLAADVGSVLVTDASPGMIEVARQRITESVLAERMSAVIFDPTSDDADPGEFDVIWSMMALHHVTDTKAALTRLRDLLVSDGWLALADLDEDPGGSFHAGHDDFVGHDGFDRDRLANLLGEIGFRDIAFDTATSVTHEIDGETRTYPVFLVTARRT